MTFLALTFAVAASSASVDAAHLHDMIVAPLALSIDVDAEHTWSAREERALGAAAIASATLAGGTFELASAVGRDLPIDGYADPRSLKLGVSAAWGVALGPITPSIVGVVENGTPRLDLALAIAAYDDVALAVEVEDVLAPQVRLMLEWTLGN